MGVGMDADTWTRLRPILEGALELEEGERDYRAPFPRPWPVALAHTWLLRVGWRRLGLIALSPRPGTRLSAG